MRFARRLAGIGIALSLIAASPASPQDVPADKAPAPAPLFAVVFRTGPKWDAAKPPNEQAFFKEHSANLRRLREAGSIAIGARYGDVGLIVVTANGEAEVRRLFEADTSVTNGTFQMDVHAFYPFFKGCVN